MRNSARWRNSSAWRRLFATSGAADTLQLTAADYSYLTPATMTQNQELAAVLLDKAWDEAATAAWEED